MRTFVFCFLLAAACERPPLQTSADASAAASSPAASVAVAPIAPAALPKRSRLFIDDTGFRIDGSFIGPSEGDRLTGVLEPYASAEPFPVDAARNAKPSFVVTALRALRRAHATSSKVTTDDRNRTPTELLVTLLSVAVPNCSAVALIGKDASISVWTVGGTVAKKFPRGFGGPDMTLGSEGLRATAALCNGPALFVGADDVMNWGLVFDLAFASRGSPDAGRKSLDVAVIAGTVVAGRRVALD
jgi:hypothetical protein